MTELYSWHIYTNQPTLGATVFSAGTWPMRYTWDGLETTCYARWSIRMPVIAEYSGTAPVLWAAP